MSVIYVLDTETTGLNGCPEDHVVEIGVAGLDTRSGKVWPVYNCKVGYDVSKWDKEHREAWVFKNTDLTLEEISTARTQQNVHTSLCNILRGADVTAYNTPFDFYKMLYRDPWKMLGVFNELPDIMKAATPVCKVLNDKGNYKSPKLEQAYRMLCPDDPAQIEGVQEHRALSDAIVASYVLRAMIEQGAYAIGGDSQ